MGLFSPGEVRSLAKPAGAETLDTLDDVANAEAPSDRGGVCGAGDGGGDWPYVASELVGGLFHVFLGGDPVARSGDLRDVASEAHVAAALRDVARRVGRAPGGLGALRVAARVPGRASADEILGAADPLVNLAAEHASEPVARAVRLGAGQESDMPNFKGSYLGRFPLVSADFWTSDHLSERSRSVDDFLEQSRAEHSR
jgi:hypothetical protein